MRVRTLRYVRRAAVISSPLCILAILALSIGCQQDPTAQAIDGLKSSSASERLQAVQVLAEASSGNAAQTRSAVPLSFNRAVISSLPAVIRVRLCSKASSTSA